MAKLLPQKKGFTSLAQLHHWCKVRNRRVQSGSTSRQKTRGWGFFTTIREELYIHMSKDVLYLGFDWMISLIVEWLELENQSSLTWARLIWFNDITNLNISTHEVDTRLTEAPPPRAGRLYSPCVLLYTLAYTFLFLSKKIYITMAL